MDKFLWLNDKLWRQYALKICGSQYDADDLVQEMYLKLSDKKELSKKYVYLTLYSLFIDSKRKQRHDVEISNKIELSESQKNKYDDLHVTNELSKVPFKIRECFIEHQNKSYRQMQEEFNINYATIRRMSEKAKAILSKSVILKELYNGK